jgi:hypothetical protein
VNYFKLLLTTIIGICISQIIATFHVYLANLQLANQIQYLHANGYLIVPNLHVLPHLQSLNTAFVGGLFFSGTIGLGIISITLFVSWFWVNITQKSKLFLLIILSQWIIAIYFANKNGWSVFTLYLCIMLPLLTGIHAIIPAKRKPSPRYSTLFWSFPIIFMIIAGYSTGRSISFLSIRDYLLLSNKTGSYLNELYYRYTLYPGEIIKPFALKQQKTCYIQTDINNAKRYIKGVQRKCIRYDYLVVPDKEKADVVLKIDPPNIFFQLNDKTVLHTSIMDYLRETKKVFLDFSSQTDVNNFFRMCILLSLVVSAPILIYILMMQGLFVLVCLTRIPTFLGQCLVVGMMCIWIGQMILQIPPDFSKKATQNEWHNAFHTAYQQLDWRQAVVLLKSHHFSITREDHQLALKWLKQTDFPVLKYWLIRFLSGATISTDKDIFLNFLTDPNMNVVCQALYASGKQRDRKQISLIKDFIQNNPNWYAQMYAYRALKRLGWRNYPQLERNR